MNSCGACNGCNDEERHRRKTAAYEDKLKAAHIRIFGPGVWEELDALRREPFKRSAAELVEFAREMQRKGEDILRTTVPVSFPKKENKEIIL